MSLPRADQPFADEEEDRKRKAEIEGMMRSQRESYFRNEPVQQEYRNIVDRQMAAQRPESEATVNLIASREAYDEALARFRQTGSFFPNDPKEGAAAVEPFAPSGAEGALPDAGVGKGDRLPVSAPELRQSPSAVNPSGNAVWNSHAGGAPGLPVRRQEDPAGAFEVDTPLRFAGEDRVEELQQKPAGETPANSVES